MANQSPFALDKAQVESLAALLGLDISFATSPYGLELQQRDLLMLLLQSGLGQITDTTAPPEEETPPPPVAEADPEPAVIEPTILVQDSYVPDPNAFSPYNKPRLSAAVSADYFPPAVSGVPGATRFFGLAFNNIATTMTFRRLEVPLRRKNVKGGELFGLHVLKKVGTQWVSVASRYATLPANLPRMVWERTFVFPAGESWAIIWGLNGENPDTNNIFYGGASSYPAPYANSAIGYDAGMPSTTGALYTLTSVPGSHRMIRLYGVNLPKDVIGPLDPADLPAGTGGSLARGNVTLTTPSLAAGAQHSATVVLGATSAIISLTTSHAARVRLYSTQAARTADASRAATADPGEAVAPYLIAEAVLPLSGALTIPVGVLGSSIAGPVTNDVYALVDNTGGTAQAITVTLTRLALEVV